MSRFVVAVLPLLLVACGGDQPTECVELGDACHDAATAGSAEALECHEFGHDGTDAGECVAKMTECEAVCTVADTDDTN